MDESLAGSETIAQHVRDAERDESVAAIVFHVNSHGGSAVASDLIWREVDRVRRKKPVVVVLGDVAASGGYYVAAPAPHILAQPLTITGSIGVITLKIVTAGLYEKLKANRVVLKRGAHAGLYADDAPFTPEMRAVAEAQTDDYYADFKEVVMAGRRLDEAALEPVAGGRVWLGRQALEHRLVDSFGGVHEAIEKAKALAKLPATRYTPTVWYGGSGGSLLPPPFPSTAAGAAGYASLIQAMLREHVWMITPFKIQ
jgi:protease-4